jgi:hypothetical protein
MRENRLMAAKVIMMKLLQEIRGFAETSNRRPQSRCPGLFIMQLRSHLTHTTLPRCKRSILVDAKGLADGPHPVKITHVRGSAVPTARL